MRFAAISALSENRVIGQDGDIPWDIPEDTQFYHSTAAGHPLIMGRKTFTGPTIGNADYIVMSRSERSYDSDRVHAVQSGEEALRVAESLLDKYETDTVYNLGGGEIYELFLPYTSEMILSHIHGTYEGDAFFPEWDEDEWRVTKESQRDEFDIVWYENKDPEPLSEFSS